MATPDREIGDWGDLENEPFLTATKEYLEKHIAEATQIFRLSPTTLLTKLPYRPIAASDLKVDSSSEVEAKARCHFKKFNVGDDENKWLEEFLNGVFEYYINTPAGKQFVTYIGTCMGQILSNVSMLFGPVEMGEIKRRCTITSESELRLAIADPIIKMICLCWGYKVTKFTCI